MFEIVKQKWFKKSTEKATHMLLADIAGNAADLLFLRFQDSFDKAVPIFKSSFKQVMHYPMQAIQAPLEWSLGQFGGIEGDKEKEARLSQTSEQRLEGLLNTSYHYLSAAAVGYATLIGTEKALSNIRGTGHVPNKMWWRLDIPVHVGAALLLGSNFMKPATGVMKDKLKGVMKIFGWTEDKAEQDARFTIAYILPNYLTLIPTVGMMSSLYHAEEKGLIRETTKQSWVDKITGGRASKYTGGLISGEAHGFELAAKDTDLSKAGFLTKIARKPLGIVENPSTSKSLSA